MQKRIDTDHFGLLVGALGADGDHKLDVTGHSLGGYLAMAFGSLFASATNQVTVFNAPGFKNTAAVQTVESSNESVWRMAA